MRKVRPMEWVQPQRKGYRMACCDCGLVHVMDFRIYEGRVQFRADRDDTRTTALRLERGIAHMTTPKQTDEKAIVYTGSASVELIVFGAPHTQWGFPPPKPKSNQVKRKVVA